MRRETRHFKTESTGPQAKLCKMNEDKNTQWIGRTRYYVLHNEILFMDPLQRMRECLSNILPHRWNKNSYPRAVPLWPIFSLRPSLFISLTEFPASPLENCSSIFVTTSSDFRASDAKLTLSYDHEEFRPKHAILWWPAATVVVAVLPGTRRKVL